METKPSRGMELIKRTKGRLVSQGMVDPNIAASIEIPGDKIVIPPVIPSVKPDPVEEPLSSIEYDVGEPPVSTEPVKKVIPRDMVPNPADDDYDPEVDDLIDSKQATAVNFGNLRKKAKTANKKVKELETRIQTEYEPLKVKLSEYESGMAIPEILQEKDQRIAELEPFQKLYDLKSTSAYQEEFVKPMDLQQEALKVHASAHGVQDGLLQAAYSAENDREQNRILSAAYAGDTVAVLEAKNILNSMKGIQMKASAAEADAKNSLSEFQAKSTELKIKQTQKRYDEAIVVSKDAWGESLRDLEQDDRFPEIKFREGDSEYNDMVKKFRMRAGQEFGKMVSDISQNGITKPVAIAIAKSNTLSHFAGYLANQNKVQAARIAELENALKESNTFGRPGVNSTTSLNNTGYRTSSGKHGVGLENAGRNALSRVTGKR